MKISKTTLKYSGDGIRLDKYLADNKIAISRSKAQKLIKSKDFLINGVAAKPSQILKDGDTISIQINDKPKIDLKFKNKHNVLNIIYENDDVIVVNKPSGLSVHTTPTTKECTLCDYLLDYYPQISKTITDSSDQIAISRPGIVHRLDKDTSGVMIVAKNVETLKYLSSIFKSRSVKKEYYALCYAWPQNQQGILRNYLGRKKSDRKIFTEVGLRCGKYALSKFCVEKFFRIEHVGDYSFINFMIHTGRTHQIRAQSLLMRHPVLGDKYYYSDQSKLLSKRLSIKRQMLHSYSLTIKLPNCESSSIFKAKLPQDIEQHLSDDCIQYPTF